MIKKQIPNLFTFLNMFSGLIAVFMAFSDNLTAAALFVMLGIFFDFFDGFFARLFKVEGDLGKELDSMADLITSGVAPGVVMFQLLLMSTQNQWFGDLNCEVGNWQSFDQTEWYYLPFLSMLIPMSAAYRLAKFNLDERQSTSFIGLPTPALSLFVVSLPLILFYSDSFLTDLVLNPYVLIAITFIGSFLLNSELRLFALKFKDYSFQNNAVKYVFILLTLILILIFKTAAIPLVIILYILMSLIENLSKKK